MADEKQPEAPSPVAPFFRTAADIAGIEEQLNTRGTPGLSHASGLEAVPDSFAPATATGEPIPHVRGPGQNPVDPVAAGLDTMVNMPTRNDNRVVTRTGADAAGPRPFTYIEKTGPNMVPQAAPADGAHVAIVGDQPKDTGPVIDEKTHPVAARDDAGAGAKPGGKVAEPDGTPT